MAHAWFTAAALAASLVAPAGAFAAPETPLGTWLTQEGDSRIRITPCGKALCATIAWTRESGIDKQNPKSTLRKRPLVGVELSTDMVPDGDGGYKGSIYNPENGKTYAATMRRRSQAELEVGGCVMGGLLCGSETWKRQPDDTAMNLAPARP